MEVIRSRKFANGVVYALQLHDGLPIETTDTFLPWETKDAATRENNIAPFRCGSRAERWMVGVSVMSGCPVGCKFCATATLPEWRLLTAEEIVDQIGFVVDSCPERPGDSREFKINYTRMGEPFLNIKAVRDAVEAIDGQYTRVHHYISTIGINGSDFSWIKGNITLQLSLHSLDAKRRSELIPVKNLLSLRELGEIRTGSDLKTTLNLTLVDHDDFDIVKLREYFDPDFFFVKLSPINPNSVSEAANLGSGIITQSNSL